MTQAPANQQHRVYRASDPSDIVLTVTVDGVKDDWCTEACPDGGWVTRILHDGEDVLTDEKGHILTERIYGVVVVEASA